MSFWASSYSFQLESFRARFARIQSGPVRACFYDNCKETRAMFPGLLFSIESIDAMLGRVQARPFNRGPNFSMKHPGAQEQ
jgi:hypothetical protein